MNGENGGLDKNARIVIVGAGPAGLSTAWFLHKHGFDNVTVIERLGRIGGLCKSLTVDGMSYDLGANYVTWAYRETLAIAKEVGAGTYPEKPYTSIELNRDETRFIKYRSLFERYLLTLRYGRSSWHRFDICGSAGGCAAASIFLTIWQKFTTTRSCASRSGIGWNRTG
jgi:cation diffusion facilitator CzcD-associated flavoprotein CzcO